MFRFCGTWQFLFCVVLLGLAKSIGAENGDCGVDSPDYPVYDESRDDFDTLVEQFHKERADQDLKINCNQHQGEKEACDKCHHNEFKKVETIENKFGGNVKQCCGEHGYIFRDQCQVYSSFFRLADLRVGPFFCKKQKTKQNTFLVLALAL